MGNLIQLVVGLIVLVSTILCLILPNKQKNLNLLIWLKLVRTVFILIMPIVVILNKLYGF